MWGRQWSAHVQRRSKGRPAVHWTWSVIYRCLLWFSSVRASWSFYFINDEWGGSWTCWTTCSVCTVCLCVCPVLSVAQPVWVPEITHWQINGLSWPRSPLHAALCGWTGPRLKRGVDVKTFLLRDKKPHMNRWTPHLQEKNVINLTMRSGNPWKWSSSALSVCLDWLSATTTPHFSWISINLTKSRIFFVLAKVNYHGEHLDLGWLWVGPLFQMRPTKQQKCRLYRRILCDWWHCASAKLNRTKELVFFNVCLSL